jgi:hypothetical protein
MSASDDAPTGRAGGVRRVTRDSAILASGSVANGLLAYVFFALATQSLGADRAAPVAVLWSYWALAAAVLTLAVQHWVIRTLAHDGHGATVAASIPRIVVGSGVLSVVAGLVAFAFRQTLFDLDGLAFPAMVAAVTAGSLFTGLVRGALAGRERYRPTAASLAGENLVRVLAAILVAILGGGAEAFGVALLVGPLVGLVWLRSLRFETPARVSAIRNPLALLSGIAGGMLLAQIVLTGAPVVLAVAGGASAEVTSLFVALAVIGVTLLQPVLHAIFGSDVDLSDRQLVELGTGTAVALGNLALLLMLLALGRSRSATGAWLVALAVSGGWILVSGMEPLERVVLAFLIAQLTAFAMSYAMARPTATLTTFGDT